MLTIEPIPHRAERQGDLRVRVLVCGGRDYHDVETVHRVLDRLHERTPSWFVIHGAERRADTLAGLWAKQNDVPVEAYPAAWPMRRSACVLGFLAERERPPWRVSQFMKTVLPLALRTERRDEVSRRMNPDKRVSSSRIVRRPSAVSTSLLSTPALDVDLHLVLAHPLPDIVIATTFVRVSFHEERVAVELSVSEREAPPDADAVALAAAEAIALQWDPAACREFVRRAIAVATAPSPN
jgi:hypothetical protein